jgi:hypothetical protein
MYEKPLLSFSRCSALGQWAAAAAGAKRQTVNKGSTRDPLIRTRGRGCRDIPTNNLLLQPPRSIRNTLTYNSTDRIARRKRAVLYTVQRQPSILRDFVQCKHTCIAGPATYTIEPCGSSLEPDRTTFHPRVQQPGLSRNMKPGRTIRPIITRILKQLKSACLYQYGDGHSRLHAH